MLFQNGITKKLFQGGCAVAQAFADFPPHEPRSAHNGICVGQSCNGASASAFPAMSCDQPLCWTELQWGECVSFPCHVMWPTTVLLNILELVSYRAMEDAECMIRLFPEHAKSYYRKGEILTAMKVSMLLSSRTHSPPHPLSVNAYGSFPHITPSQCLHMVLFPTSPPLSDCIWFFPLYCKIIRFHSQDEHCRV
jgi:hypothetical protein